MIVNPGPDALVQCVPPGASTMQLLPLGALSGDAGPWATVLYVDPTRGNDATGTRGDGNRPFATPQAAVNQMQTGDQVEVMAVRITLAAPITIPATVVSGSIVSEARNMASNGFVNGQGPQTLLRNPAGSVFDFGANLGLSTFVIAGCSINGVGATSVVADFSAYTLGQNPVLDFVDCQIGGGAGVSSKYALGINFYKCTSILDSTFQGVSFLTFFDTYTSTAANFTYIYDVSDPKTPISPTASLNCGWGTVLGTVTLSAQASLLVDSTSSVWGVKGSALTVSGTTRTTIGVAGNVGPGNIDFASAGRELPDTTNVMTIQFRPGQGAGQVNILSPASGVAAMTAAAFKVGGAAANSQNVTLEMASTSAAFTANQGVNLSLGGALLPGASFSTPDASGTIQPTRLSGTVNLAAGGAVAQTWSGTLGITGLVRTTSAPKQVLITSIAQGADAVVTTKATTGFTTTATAQAGNTAASWEAIWP